MSQSNSQVNSNSPVTQKDAFNPALVKTPTINYDSKKDNILKHPGKLKSPKPLQMQVSYNTDVSYDI